MCRVPDALTVKCVTGDLPEECRFSLNTQLTSLKKEKRTHNKMFDDGSDRYQKQRHSPLTFQTGRLHTARQTTPRKNSKSMPKRYEMGDFVRKYVSWQLLALSEGEFCALMTAMRQVGVGSQGGVEAVTIFHQLIFDEWSAGSVEKPLARIKVDEKTALE